MARDRGSKDMMALGAVLMAGAIVIFINLLAERKFWRVDLTDEGRYSLSEPFKDIVTRLESPAKLTYYVSASVPGNFVQSKRDIMDKLFEISTISRGKIELEVIDPDREPEVREELEQRRLKFIMPEISRDRRSFSALFTSMRITYQDKPAAWIPVVGQAEDLEYELASRLLELTLKERPVIAIHAPKPARPPSDDPRAPMVGSGYEWLLQSEEQQKKFDVKQVEWTEKSGLPEGTKLLILIAPDKLGERARYEIVRYLAEGGRVLLIDSGFRIKHEIGFQAEKASSGMETYLEGLGIRFGSKFVCDNVNVQLPDRAQVDPFGGQAITYRPLPFYVKIDPSNVDQEEPVTRLLPGLVMPFPGEMFVDEQKAVSAGLQLKVLARTSAESWTEDHQEVMDLRKIRSRSSGFEGANPVFAKLTGHFPFPWKGKTVPAWLAAEGESPEDASAAKQEPVPDVKSGEGLLLVWTCPDSFNIRYFMDQQGASEFRGNEMVIPNVAEAASLGEGLISIRRKKYETRSIGRVADPAKRNLIKMFLIAGMPALLLALGSIRWLIRRNAQLGYERSFSETTGPSSFSP